MSRDRRPRGARYVDGTKQQVEYLGRSNDPRRALIRYPDGRVAKTDYSRLSRFRPS